MPLPPPFSNATWQGIWEGGTAPRRWRVYVLLDNFRYHFSQHTKSVFVTTSMSQCVCVFYMNKSLFDSEGGGDPRLYETQDYKLALCLLPLKISIVSYCLCLFSYVLYLIYRI